MNMQIGLKQILLPLLLAFATATPVIADDAKTPSLPLTIAENDDGFLVSEDGKPVLQYQLRTKSLNNKWPRNNYIHPLYNLDGEVITEDFPDDHKHHRGIFWAWHQVTAGDVRLGDSWLCKDFIWEIESSEASRNDGGSAALATQLVWKSPALVGPGGNPIAVVRERTTITVHPVANAHRSIDFDIRLKALLPNVKIGGSEDAKGYGGFSPRIKLSKDQVFRSSTGKLKPKKLPIKAGPWMDVSNSSWGLTILTHPANPGFPEPWILRSQRSMQNAAYPGASSITLPTELETHLRYRLVIHRGAQSRIDFAEQQERFAQSTKN